MKLLFDRATHLVVGINREPQPFEYEHTFDGTPVVEKEESIFLGTFQSLDAEGNPLYLDAEGNETTSPYVDFPPVYGEKSVEEDVDGDGTLETVIYKDAVLVEGYRVEHEPKMEDKYEVNIITFKERPFSFTYGELKDAPVQYSKEQLKEMETTQLQMAVVELFETNIDLQLSNSLLKQETENVMLAVTELYEMLLGGGN